MKVVSPQVEAREENDRISLCSLIVQGKKFGIDTGKIREVLGKRDLVRVPMAPAFVAGVVPYRGDVLTVVSFRALLGQLESSEPGCVLVLEEDDSSERFGLTVDSVGGVVVVDRKMLEHNPSTLDTRCRSLFDGAFKMQGELIVQLHPNKLRPSRLVETEIFRGAHPGEAA